MRFLLPIVHAGGATLSASKPAQIVVIAPRAGFVEVIPIAITAEAAVVVALIIRAAIKYVTGRRPTLAGTAAPQLRIATMAFLVPWTGATALPIAPMMIWLICAMTGTLVPLIPAPKADQSSLVSTPPGRMAHTAPILVIVALRMFTCVPMINV